MPKLNRKDSVLSVDSFVITPAYEKLNGPTGVYQSMANPAELLILFDSSTVRHKFY